MRTHDDLHAVFATREALAPEPQAVLAEVHRMVVRRRRSRATLVATAAATTTVVVVAVGVVSRPDGRGVGIVDPRVATSAVTATPTPTIVRPAFSFTLLGSTVAGFDIRPTGVGPDGQVATVLRHGHPEAIAQLSLSDPSPSGQVELGSEAGVAVSVNGRTGVYVLGEQPTLRWEYAPGATAELLSFEDLKRETLVEIAEGLRFGIPYPATVPYKLGYLPDGMKPFNVVQGWGSFASVVQFEAPDLILDITVYRGSPAREFNWQPTTAIAGHPTKIANLIDGTRYAVDFGQFTVDIGSNQEAKVEVARIVEGLTITTKADPSSWIDIDDALPGS